MKILKSWLKDYIDIKLSDVELIEKLNLTGTEVDSANSTLDEKIIVAEIQEVAKHPNADKLNLAKVFTGKETLEIVCGAPNIAAGQKVPLAQTGAKLSDFEIKEAVIRGIKSNGMLCSEKELGLGEDHSGIKILPDDFEIGESLNRYFEGDLVLELEITPNRGDCLSHIGIAREIVAFSNQNLAEKKIDDIKTENKAELKVDIEAPEACQQYCGQIIENVKIGPSPEWLQKRLIACGAKPINNVVDVTNYILLDLGQPLHAFDADKIKDKNIIVRTAKENETVISLDGATRDLPKDALMIADSEKAVAIAGIMGGKNSEISTSTTKIILESAEFDRKSIRKTSKNLKLVTEASYRFERGIDSGSVEKALKKAAMMIVEIAGGKLVGDVIKAGNTPAKQKVHTKYDKINDLLGLKLKNKEIDDILKPLGFEIKNEESIVPLWRHDVESWQDLAEEVGRIYGYEKIILFPVTKNAEQDLKNNYHRKEFLKNILVNFGFSEVLNYSFLSEKDTAISKINPADLLEIANPIQPENKYLRNSIIPGLLKSVAKNPSFDPILLFEVGNIFSKENESTSLGIVAAGKNAKKNIDAVVCELKKEIGLADEIHVGEVAADDLNRYKIKKSAAFVAEISIEKIIKNLKQKPGPDFSSKVFDLASLRAGKKIHYRPVSKYPSVVRDLAFIVDKNIDSSTIIDFIYDQSDLINRVELFDEFVSDKFGLNKKNLAFHIDLQNLNRTLTDKEADEIVEKIIKVLKEKFNAELRNY